MWAHRQFLDVKMPKMTKDDQEAFLEIFKRAAIASGLKKVRWTGQLGLSYQEDSPVAYRAMT